MKNNIFGQRIKYLRTEKNLTQKQICKIFQVSQRTISFWETGNREPDLDTIISFADFFNVSIDFLFGKQDF